MDAPIEVVELQPRRALTVRRTVPQSGLGAFFMELFPRVRTAIVANGATASGPLFARYCQVACVSRRSPGAEPP